MDQCVMICRICLEEPNDELICMNSSDEVNNMRKSIEEVAGFKLSKLSTLPDKICRRCVDLLKCAIKFRFLCERSEEHFKIFFEKQFATPLKLWEEKAKTTPTEAEESIRSNSVFSMMNDDVYDVQSEPEIDLEYTTEEINYNSSEEFVQPQYVEYLQEDSKEPTLWGDAQYIVIEEKENSYISNERDKKIDELVISDKKKTAKVKKISNRTIKQNQKICRQKKKPIRIKAEVASTFICSFCGNFYNEKAKLTTHMKVHTQSKPHECEICHKRFCQAPQLTRHMNSHTGNRPYKCKYCDSSFADPSTKIKHERIHTQERPFQCHICNKSFAYSNVLKVHMMIHTGEKPHDCKICGKKFSQLHHKKAHERLHSPVGTISDADNNS